MWLAIVILAAVGIGLCLDGTADTYSKKYGRFVLGLLILAVDFIFAVGYCLWWWHETP